MSGVEGHHPPFEGDWILMLVMEEKWKPKTISGVLCLVVCMVLVSLTRYCSRKIYTPFLDMLILQTIHEVDNITTLPAQGGIHHWRRVKGHLGLKVLVQGMEGVEDLAGVVGNMMAVVLGMIAAVVAIVVNTAVVVGLVVELMCMTLLAEIQAPTLKTCECSYHPQRRAVV